ncbi:MULTISPECIES: hypothetical protein [unclassified Agarivorans]|uniref:hypothetical protein n=1 Tax=unclassified Agarivorans TaxID=2636026 RepID=UPI0026E3792C|nr:MULTISPECIES: hypothetical protein [unclassified Agarivorans]MDO6688112.1 hypothetical protein [Agarivorans sp. 3_MG-2023]MDO6717744.1 hypothetical protein [Agarivorans sp. 2_MG-2023]
MSKLPSLEKSLKEYGLSEVLGSPFDNAFEVFNHKKDDINLILLGTNGNMTDAIKNNSEWVRERARTPKYSHLMSGDWGKSPLRKELIKVPSVLNDCFDTDIFSSSKMILTNGLLLASNGVSDIQNQFNILSENSSKFNKLKDLLHSSMGFFNDFVINNSNPKIIFAYGNSDQGHSAWKYLRGYYPEIKKKIVVPIKSTSYKFCSLDINGKEVFIIGSPHPCFHYNKLNKSLIQQGLNEIGAL